MIDWVEIDVVKQGGEKSYYFVYGISESFVYSIIQFFSKSAKLAEISGSKSLSPEMYDEILKSLNKKVKSRKIKGKIMFPNLLEKESEQQVIELFKDQK